MKLKMKKALKNTYLLPVLGICALMYSCTTEIDLDLNSSDPQIVVEGGISNNKTAQISITESVNFDAENNFPTVENAVVEIEDASGNYELLTETAPGVYEGSKVLGTIGNSYTLTVTSGTKILSSTVQIQNLVEMDSIKIITTTGGGGGFGGGPGGGSGSNESYDVEVYYQDPPNVPNYYRFEEYINSEFQAYYVFRDRLTDGSSLTRSLSRSDRKLNPGDTLTIEIQNIDESVYEYLNSFGNLAGGPVNSTTPANPYSNIDGAVLGYFSAYSSERKTVIAE